MFATKAGGDGTFFERVVDGVRGAEILFNDDVHAAKHFGHEEVIAGFIQRGFFRFVPSSLAWQAES